VPQFVSESLRGMICAPEGRVLAGADFSAIEARVVLWLARDPGLDILARGEDIYVEMAKAISLDATRQLGKQAVLGCGFGMGAPKFRETCGRYGIEIDEALALRAVLAYRGKFFKVPRLWRAIECAAIAAVQKRVVTRLSAAEFVPLTFRMTPDGTYLTVELPSGRKLYYPYPEVSSGKYGQPQLSYMTVDGVTKQWVRFFAWYGILVENVVQAIARDLMAHAMWHLDKLDGIDLLFSVHDEIVVEMDEDDGRDIGAAMCVLPVWAEGLPIAAESFRGRRYS
jgi:DNA polymerase